MIMKRIARIPFFMCFIAAALLCQPVFAQTLKDVFNSSETPLLYLGIDFTKAKLIDDPVENEMVIRDRHFNAINQVVITEAKKYDLGAAFHKTTVDHDLAAVTKRNEAVDAGQIKSTNSADFHRLKESDIASLVKGFDFPDKKGIAVLFVMEAMSKSGKAAAIWVTFIDTKAKKVLLTERIESEVKGGIMFRNYWASSIKYLLDEIEDKKYNEWKNKNS